MSSHLQVSTVKIPAQLANVSLASIKLHGWAETFLSLHDKKVLNATSTPENSAPNEPRTAGENRGAEATVAAAAAAAVARSHKNTCPLGETHSASCD